MVCVVGWKMMESLPDGFQDDGYRRAKTRLGLGARVFGLIFIHGETWGGSASSFIIQLFNLLFICPAVCLVRQSEGSIAPVLYNPGRE
jgi:hypothetical protein